MDSFLIDYLKSGKAWVLVGSGPSIEMGYPTWEKLSSSAAELVKQESMGRSLGLLNSAMACRDFPKVFDEAKTILGGPRLLQGLSEKLKPTRTGHIYEHIARWPVPVYLTTNYDDEIHAHLVSVSESYLPYSNSEDHFKYLLPELTGAIVKLHGDLRSEKGLILTTTDYRQIQREGSWAYWRTKMTSVFQMNRIVVIGHSLSDPNIRHVLEAAKQGAGVLLPICWIAPNVSPEECRNYLDNHRIRVISYDNKNGEHRNLARLIESISDFIPSRVTVHIQSQIENVSHSPLEASAGAPGFFVFSKLSSKLALDQKRIDILMSAIQSALPKLLSMDEFTLQMALETAGWPKNFPLDFDTADKVSRRAIEGNLLVSLGNNKFKVHTQAEAAAIGSRKSFEHMRERFKNSLQLRLKRDYPTLDAIDVTSISSDIEAALTGYFREGGLSLATTLFSTKQPSTRIPSSIIKFINQASARYDDLLKRQAFFTASVEAFLRAGSAEREYLGRISQGFFAFHALGVFGDVAIEKLQHAKETVWLIDSDMQIAALALAAPTNTVLRDTFLRLKALGIRLFSTTKLFDETREHLWFANKVVKDRGAGSVSVISAATGQSPYPKSNVFLQGFITWQAAGNPCDWENYLFHIFGETTPEEKDILDALNKVGIEVIPFADWPGFSDADFSSREQYTEKIKKVWNGTEEETTSAEEFDLSDDAYKKAQPEAEALLIVRNERLGTYYVLSKCGEESPSWFVSHTSILNLVEPKVTWQPESFLKFASTLSSMSTPKAANEAFETLLWGLARSGITLLDEKMVETVFGGIIDQATLDIQELRQAYEDTLATKYSESYESVMKRIRPIYRPLAALQLANEIAQAESKRRQVAESQSKKKDERLKQVEQELKTLDRFRKKMEAKKRKGKRKAKKQQARRKKKGKQTPK
jgi:hypothetical protein